MNKKIFFRFIFFFFLFLSVIQNLYSQQKDFGAWTGINFDYNVSKKIKLGVTDEIRFSENISRVASHLLQPSIEYKAFKKISFRFGYRWSVNQDKNSNFLGRHRFQLLMKYKQPISKNLNLGARVQFQKQYKNNNPENQGPKNILRTRAGLSYKINKKISADAFAEAFYNWRIERPLDLMRYNLECTYQLTKKDALSLGYIFQNEYNKANPSYESIITFSYSKDLTKAFKKKNKK